MATQLKKVVAPSGGDYTSLEACMNANEQNLVAADQYFDVEISGTWSSADTTAVVVHNYTTDATRYINIYTTGNARHSGIWSTTAYRLITTANAANVGIITDAVGNLYVDGLQVQNTDTTGTFSAVFNSASGSSVAVVKNNILRGGRRCVKNDQAYTGYFFNNIIYGVGVSGFYSGTASTWYLYSNTVIGATDGINRQSGTVTAKNNYVSATTAITGTVTQTTNATSDTTAADASLDNIAYDTNNFTNVTSGSEDLRLPAGSALINVGTDTSGESAPLNFNTDITGATRTGTWDIGADEYVALSTTGFMTTNPRFW